MKLGFMSVFLQPKHTSQTKLVNKQLIQQVLHDYGVQPSQPSYSRPQYLVYTHVPSRVNHILAGATFAYCT